MKNPLGVPSWRQAVIMIVGLPLVIALAVMAYAWPAARIAPRDLPVGVVSTGTASQSVVEGLEHGRPGAFDIRLYPDQAAARSAIEHRDVYGAFVVAPGHVTVLEATAASPTVAQLVDAAGHQLAAHTAASAGGTSTAASGIGSGSAPASASASGAGGAGAVVRTVDVVPTSVHDPRGLAFSASLLPLTICSIIIALFTTIGARLRPGPSRVVPLMATCAAAAFAVYLVAQTFLGALPHDHAATWAAVALTMLAISAPTAGLVTLLGHRGLGLSAALMVFVGNPFSGSTSAPELLPKAAADIGRWLPPGAGAGLVRGTAYFGGSGSAGPLVVLGVWSVLGLAVVAFGRRRPVVPEAVLVAEGGTDGLSLVPPRHAAPPGGRVPRP
ncbi:ABC transporter permease [Streptomyces sp. NBC_01198]|uniref:ABC transporter permease n=1 Tax=Streptomyces sp. NBC_01198 TaxID=2903769 RepID=UPI002E122663|nr:ABC transporter permease [Streptomyces sp. NBC_01198]